MNTPVNWDPFGLFESLLRDFGSHLERAQRVRSSHPPGAEQTHIAVSGFLLFSPADTWGQQEYELITTRVAGELSLEELEWYEESAEAVQMFSCLALGAIMGKYTTGEINDRGFLLGDAHLTAFLVDRSPAILERYLAFRSS